MSDSFPKQLAELREIFADGPCTIPAIQRHLKVGFQRATKLFRALYPEKESSPDFLILNGDALQMLRAIADESVQCCVTSPPYWGLRDYGCAGQIGLEPTVDEFISKLVDVFREVRRVLKKDGTAWVNMGDAYASSQGKHSPDDKHGAKQDTNRGSSARTDKISPGLKPKDLIGQPWLLAFALRADGWWLRQDIIWHKPNPMSESIRDRCTKAHEYLFLLTKSERYFYDYDAMQEPVTGHAHRRSAVKPPAGWGQGDEPITAIGLQVSGVHRKTKLPSSYNGSDLRKGKKAQVHDNIGQGERAEHLAPGVTPKSAESGSGIKANESFHAACCDLVEIRNKRSVWTVPSAPYSEAHFATFPPALITPCILAGSRPGDTILDPFGGSGTTGQVALEHGRKAILIELNPDYIPLIERRCTVTKGLGI
ncbi:MAG: site-specific DNA-methyltransferase [Verrucomicrobiae bacterium]